MIQLQNRFLQSPPSPGAGTGTEWARVILAARQLGTDRKKGTEIVREAGYDIHTEAQKLQNIYLRMADRK